MKSMKRYKDEDDNNSDDDGFFGNVNVQTEFKHDDRSRCFWTIYPEQLAYFKHLLFHLDLFINSTKYTMPNPLFQYLYNDANGEWMNNEENARSVNAHRVKVDKECIMLNESQREAIAKALVYPISLIQGPPGTGKTLTLSHLCSFILGNRHKESHEIIVVVAHSNAACDRILESLISLKNLKIPQNRIVRFGSMSKIAKHLKKFAFTRRLKREEKWATYCRMRRRGNIDGARELLKTMSRNILMDKVDIVVTTCFGSTSQCLMKVDVPVSHLLVDEATQIVEPELLIALNLLRDKRSTEPPHSSTPYYSPQNDTMKPTFPRDDPDLEDYRKRIIMIGDPKQLSPVVRSQDAKDYGYGLSMFERLLGRHSIKKIADLVKQMDREKIRKDLNLDSDKQHDLRKNVSFKTGREYDQQEEEDKLEIAELAKEHRGLNWKLQMVRDRENESLRELVHFTMLNVQYRMKSFMMRFCNETFYNSLIETGTAADIEKEIVRGIPWKKNKSKCLLFVDLEYSKQETTTSKSHYNIAECTYIRNLILKVLKLNKKRITAKDIGVICMHRAQVTKMEKMLAQKGQQQHKKVMTEIAVNTVDGFQGQEKKLIILSMVRTGDASSDFLRSKERCNVALSRAQYGMVVVGQRTQLQRNRVWRKFAKFVERHGVMRVIEDVEDTQSDS